MIGILLSALALQADSGIPPGVEHAGRSVVALRFNGGHGSGFVIDARGWILTNAHVACSPQPYEVEARIEKDGKVRTVRFTKALLSGVHPTRDLALVKIDPAEHDGTLQAARMSTVPASVTQRVFAIGYPVNVREGAVKVYSEGRVVMPERQIHRRPYVEFLAKIAPGNSGGPICAENGDALAVVTLRDPDSDSAFAVPASEVRLQTFVPLRQRAADPAVSVDLIHLGDKYMRLFRERGQPVLLDYAAQAYENASFWDPGNDELLLKVAVFYGLHDDHRAAAAHLTRSLTLNAWPERGSLIYAGLAESLVRLGKKDDADAVVHEGLAKYPDRSGSLFAAMAADLFAGHRWVDAARASRRALRQNGPQPEELNRIHQEARARMSPQESAEFLEKERVAPTEEAARVEAAAAARRDGMATITPDFRRFLDGYTGHQREGGGIPSVAGGSLAADVDRFSADDVTRLFLQAQLKTAREFVRTRSDEKALEALSDILKDHPRSPEALEAEKLLALIRSRRNPPAR